MSTACYRTNAPDGPAEREDTGEHPDAAACNMLDNLPSACKVRRRKTQKKGGLCICLVSGRAFFASELKLQISISKVDILEADSVCRLHTYTLSLTPAQPSDSRPTPRPINLTMANQ